jgi:hypothetical protein
VVISSDVISDGVSNARHANIENTFPLSGFFGVHRLRWWKLDIAAFPNIDEFFPADGQIHNALHKVKFEDAHIAGFGTGVG